MNNGLKRPSDGALLEDMRRALLAEFGAQAIYGNLVPVVERVNNLLILTLPALVFVILWWALVIPPVRPIGFGETPPGR